jgi:hypothetical protein
MLKTLEHQTYKKLFVNDGCDKLECYPLQVLSLGVSPIFGSKAGVYPLGSGAVFTRPHFLCKLQKGPKKLYCILLASFTA